MTNLHCQNYKPLSIQVKGLDSKDNYFCIKGTNENYRISIRYMKHNYKHDFDHHTIDTDFISILVKPLHPNLPEPLIVFSSDTTKGFCGLRLSATTLSQEEISVYHIKIQQAEQLLKELQQLIQQYFGIVCTTET